MKSGSEFTKKREMPFLKFSYKKVVFLSRNAFQEILYTTTSSVRVHSNLECSDFNLNFS